MSSTPSASSLETSTSAETAATTSSSKASLAQNKAPMELNSVSGGQPALPVEEDIMQLARLGEVDAIQKLFDKGKFDAKYKDDGGITPLHWAAINNQYALCKFLLEAGADVNAKGGESVATPAMWAAQRCHYYTVNLLLQHGADPLLTDVQGYNVLHLATFDGNVFLLAILLHQGIPVDITDPHGHTSLMWAAYKGYPACVDLFLRWGANVYAADETGFTALHWALVKGPQVYVSQACIQKLIEYGSDRFVETSTGKTPAITADEMKCTRIWHRALEECGYDEDGNPKPSGLPFASLMRGKKVAMSRFFFLSPFLILICILMILSFMPIFVAVPLAGIVAYSLQWVVQQALQWAPTDMKHMDRTPFLAGCFAAMCFWVGVRWLFTILPNTYSTSPFTNLLFAVSLSLCTYFYACSMAFDPGYLPKLGGRSQEKEAIDELLGLWKFDDQNFCMQCMVRRPLRSKHCKRCGRCIAKHDHHCPWVHNCVGINNHRHFFFYLVALEVGILLLVRLVLYHLDQLPKPASSQCNILSEALCDVILRDAFTVVLTIFACLQLIWLTMLLIVQFVQIARAVTTFESMKGRHHHDHGASEAITSAITAGTTTMEGAQLTSAGHGPDPALPPDHSHAHSHREGFLGHWKKLLGLDTFVATATGGFNGPRNQRMSKQNPFSRGIITNCKDFLCDPAPVFGKRDTGSAILGGEMVNYGSMYESPPRMRSRPSRQGHGVGVYHSVEGEDAV